MAHCLAGGQLLELLRDSAWQAIGALLTLAAVVVSIVLARRRRHPKRIAYEVSVTPLVTVNSAIRDQIRILMGQREVQDVHLVLFRLVNAGQAPILKSDFDKPLSIEFEPATPVVSAELAETRPPDLDAVLDLGDRDAMGFIRRVRLAPLLLNPGDWLKFRLLVSGANPLPKLTGRIVGVRTFEEVAPSRETLPARVARALISTAVILGGYTLVEEFQVVPLVLGVLVFVFLGFATGIWVSNWLDSRIDPARRL